MSQPGDPVNAAFEAIRKDDWTRIDAAWERTRNAWERTRNLRSEERTRDPRSIHLRRDASLDSREFVRDALLVAQGRGILAIFLRELLREDLLTDDDVRRIVQLPGGPRWQLQAFQNGGYRPVPALLFGKNLLTACENVCRIDIDGNQAGTGVQVSPNFIATAAHVIEPLIDDSGAHESLRAAGDALGRLEVRFCYAEDYADEEDTATYTRPGEVADLHFDWLWWGSRRAGSDHPEFGYGVADISDINGKTGPWDLALIRLGTPRTEARPTCLLERDPPAPPFQINILHHPNGGVAAGQPLLISIGLLQQHLGKPPLRCLHDASTATGSSGAPVFDSRWRVLALHQGGGTYGAWAGHNRAVPVMHWRDRIQDLERELQDEAPYLTELRTSTDLTPYPYPVIGRRETQLRTWRAMKSDASPQQRLLIVRGEPGTGRRFTKRLVREMVSGTDAVVAVLDMANMLDDSPAEFVERVTGALSAELRLPDSTSLTTNQRMIRDDLVPALGQRLEQIAGNRTVWLVLEDFGDVSAAIPDTVADVISNLAAHLGDFPSLRLVLVGWTPAPVDYQTSVEELRLPTASDLVWHLSPPGDRSDTEMVDAVRAVFALAAKNQRVSYPMAQQIALRMRQMLRTEIDQGGNP